MEPSALTPPTNALCSGGKLKRTQVLIFEKRLKAQIAIGTNPKKKVKAKAKSTVARSTAHGRPVIKMKKTEAPKVLHQCMPPGVKIPKFVKDVASHVKVSAALHVS